MKLDNDYSAAACKRLIAEITKQKDMADVQVGKTLVLYRGAQHRDLELLRNVVVEKSVITIQAYNRGWRARKLAARLRFPCALITSSAVAEKCVKFFVLRYRAGICQHLKLPLNRYASIAAALWLSTGQSDACDFELFDAVNAKKLRDLILEEIRVTGLLEKAVQICDGQLEPPQDRFINVILVT